MLDSALNRNLREVALLLCTCTLQPNRQDKDKAGHEAVSVCAQVRQQKLEFEYHIRQQQAAVATATSYQETLQVCLRFQPYASLLSSVAALFSNKCMWYICLLCSITVASGT